MMTAMAVMHEQMHHRARKEQQIGKRPEDMRGVLGQQKKRGDQQKPAQDKSERRPVPGPFRMVRVIAHRLPQPPHKEIVENAEQPGDVPAPKDAFDEPQKETWPAQ